MTPSGSGCGLAFAVFTVRKPRPQPGWMSRSLINLKLHGPSRPWPAHSPTIDHRLKSTKIEHCFQLFQTWTNFNNLQHTESHDANGSVEDKARARQDTRTSPSCQSHTVGKWHRLANRIFTITLKPRRYHILSYII